MSYIRKQFERLGNSPNDTYKVIVTSSKGATNHLNVTYAQLCQIRHTLDSTQNPDPLPRFSVRIVKPEGGGYMEYRGRTSWCYSSARQHRKDWNEANPEGYAVIEAV